MGAPAVGNPQGQLAEAPPWLQQYHEQLTRSIGGAFDQLSARQEAIAGELNQVKQARAAQAAQPQMPPADAGQKILEQLTTDPVRFLGEYTQLLRGQMKQEAAAEIAKLRQEQEQNAQWGQFWQEVYHHNADLQAYAPLLQGLFQQAYAQRPQDPSAAVNSAAEYLRGLLAQERATALESEKRQRSNAQATSTGPGIQQLIHALNPAARIAQGQDDDVDAEQMNDDYVNELRADQFSRKARGWNARRAAAA